MISTKLLLASAWSYYDHKNELIYSWAAQTFLSGAPLYDAAHGGLGNIDCSTYVHLAMMGIPYEKSPYQSGQADSFFSLADPDSDELILEGLKESLNMRLFQNIDFDSLPDPEKIGNTRRIVAERFLERSGEAVTDERIDEVLEKQSFRNAFGIAQHLQKRGLTFTDPSKVRPGDLAFFRAYPRWIEGYQKFGIFMEISHVGIITEDTRYMLHATGSHNKEEDLKKGPPVQYSPVSEKRIPCLFAHCTDEA